MRKNLRGSAREEKYDIQALRLDRNNFSSKIHLW